MDLIFGFSLVAGYLAGSISSAIIVCRLMGLPDPRTQGSKNAGATNVHRIGGRWVGFLTLLGDFLKTALPMLLVYKLDYGREASLWVGVMAVIGHCFPIYFSFRGGKGVASVASLLTSLIIPFYGYHFKPELFIPLSALSAVVLLRHHSNIANLVSGTEPLIGNQ